MAEAGIGCFLFLSRHSSLRRLAGYRQLEEESSATPEVRVVVGKEKREFLVDPFVLEKDPFRVLMEMVRIDGEEERKRKDVIFVDVDAILFEHLLWPLDGPGSRGMEGGCRCQPLGSGR
ncbi:hypothetical protein J5N97_006937 [Dioscorea zingiberensis]|uniref:Uncharacterized protein n=1 Tax=Dioscorea zingiberensis TaxID=325984 RepID=A0A9D5DAW7_9LILI|nr:hypothetical protein J5N97_006937 [Dioscorea zingiberensis]